MTELSTDIGVDGHLRALRDEFDAAFAQLPPTPLGALEDFLRMRVGHDRVVLRMSAVSGLYRAKPTTALPGSPSSLLGVASFRGVFVPVYDLRELLGTRRDGSCRWMALLANDAPLGLAFDEFEGHLRVPPGSVASMTVGPGGAHGATAREMVHDGDTLRPIVDTAAIVEAIRRLVKGSIPQEEL